MNENTSKNGVLARRGILKLAQENGWEEFTYMGMPGWIYRIVSIDGEFLTNRWKARDSKARRKYAWPAGKPDEAKYYILQTTDLRAEIAKNGGTVIIASGEPDVLALAEAGILNVFCWFGETSVPESLVEDLKSWGAEKVLQFVDRDDTGVKAAKKVARMLSGTGISYTAYELPESLGEGGDINKLWMASEFNTETFKQTLETIKLSPDTIIASSGDDLFSMPSPAPVARVAEHAHTDVVTLPREFLEAIESRLSGFTHYKSNGFSNDIPCIFANHEHDSDSPAASWNQDSGVFHCFKCAETWNAKDTGERLGIFLRDYFADNDTVEVATDVAPVGDELLPLAVSDTPEASTPGLVLPEESVQPSKITDIMIGKHIMALWCGDFRYFHSRWHSYANGIWTSQDNIEKTIWNVLERYSQYGVKPSDSRVVSIASYLRSQLYVADELIDSSHGYLNLRNGLLNLETFELEEHQRDLYLTSQRSIDYDPNATCPTFDTEMDVWMRDASGNVDRQKQAVLMEAFGYSLTPETRYEKAIWLYGPAASGKSTILKVLMMLSGNAGTTLAFDYLDKNSYQLANLQGKQVAVCSEAATNSTVQSDLVKQLVSGDPMMVRQIFGAPFTLLPQAKLWYAANELPYNPDRSEGIYRRLIILEFHNSIPANERDPHLLEKLEEELPGILNKALAGLKRLQEQGHFTESSDIDASVNAYRAANDHELAFVEECCNVDERHTDDQYEHLVDHTRTMSSTLNTAYNSWRQQQGLHTKSGKQLAPEWERLGFKKKRIGGRFYWLGIEVQTQIT